MILTLSLATVNMRVMDLKLNELAEQAGVSPRTVRYYIALGLLPSPGRLGPGTRYGRDHLDRLRLVKRLQEERLSLAEIRRRIEAEPMPASAIATAPGRQVVAARPAPHSASALRQGSTQPALWERIVLSPDVELHVRAGVRDRDSRTNRIIDSARDLLRQP